MFGGKKNNEMTQPGEKAPKEKKAKKKKGKEDAELAYENPAFEIFDPGSSFNAQSGFIAQQQEQPAPAPAPVPEPQVPVEQVQAVAYDPNVQPVAYDPNAQPVAYDPNAQPVAYDPNMQQAIAAAPPAAYDPSVEQALAQVDAQQQVQADPNQQQLPQTVDYNNVMPNEAPQEVALPAEASVLKDNTQKVERPNKRYRYTIINGLGKKENGTFEAESEDDVRNFLISQDYQVLEVKERSASDIDIGGNGKMGASDLSFSLTQLSTYLRAGIPLSDSVRILAKQSKKPNIKKSFNMLVYQLLKGESLSDAMIMQDKVYPKLLINPS